MTTSVPLSLKGNLFSISLEPGIKLSDGEITPPLALDAGFSQLANFCQSWCKVFFDDFLLVCKRRSASVSNRLGMESHVLPERDWDQGRS